MRSRQGATRRATCCTTTRTARPQSIPRRARQVVGVLLGAGLPGGGLSVRGFRWAAGSPATALFELSTPSRAGLRGGLFCLLTTSSAAHVAPTPTHRADSRLQACAFAESCSHHSWQRSRASTGRQFPKNNRAASSTKPNRARLQDEPFWREGSSRVPFAERGPIGQVGSRLDGGAGRAPRNRQPRQRSRTNGGSQSPKTRHAGSLPRSSPAQLQDGPF